MSQPGLKPVTRIEMRRSAYESPLSTLLSEARACKPGGYQSYCWCSQLLRMTNKMYDKFIHILCLINYLFVDLMLTKRCHFRRGTVVFLSNDNPYWEIELLSPIPLFIAKQTVYFLCPSSTNVRTPILASWHELSLTHTYTSKETYLTHMFNVRTYGVL